MPPRASLIDRVPLLRRIRDSLALRIARYRTRRSEGFLWSVYGVWLLDRWEDVTYRFCVLGEYGFFYSGWLAEQEDCVFLDIGANVGLYSLIAGKNPGIKAIYAFEPVPETFGYLVANVQRNATQRCTPCQVGISTHPAEIQIRTQRGHSGVSTLRSHGLERFHYDSTVTVQIVGPEYIDATVNDGLASRVVVKLDVEGHELEVVETLMKSRIWPRVSNIYYEVDETYLDHAQILARLRSEGFEVIHRKGSGAHYDLMVERALSPGP